MLASVKTSIDNILSGMFPASTCKGAAQSRNSALLAGAVLLIVMPFETEHLLTMLLGALAYSAVYYLQPGLKPQPLKCKKMDVACNNRSPSSPLKERSTGPRAYREKTSTAWAEPQRVSPKTTMVPVLAPTFKGSSWEDEVAEMLQQLTPTAQCQRTVAQLTHAVKKVIWSEFPDAEISGHVSANLHGGKAFGVAVPDVDIFAKISPKSLAKRMNSRNTVSISIEDDVKQLQKYAIRICTDKLVHSAGLKFRRSAFRGEEPKVTLLAPAALGFSNDDIAVPLDFSVNSSVPVYNAALLAECEKIDLRAKQLILLVRRWAKDRGICHAAKGHLSPYVWTLLAIYFLQVEEDILPAIEQFECASKLMQKTKERMAHVSVSESSVAELLPKFFDFYAAFDWQKEAVTTASAVRGPPAPSMHPHVMEQPGCKDAVAGPSIEDPFALGKNLSTGMTLPSFQRLREEFARAQSLCNSSSSLSVLLQPWAPPSAEKDANEEQ